MQLSGNFRLRAFATVLRMAADRLAAIMLSVLTAGLDFALMSRTISGVLHHETTISVPSPSSAHQI